MCAGYNAAMRDSDAKIKIYMHQDVFIADKDFLLKLLEIFDSDSHIGMVGMVGALRLYAPRSYRTETEEYLTRKLTAIARDRIGYFVDRKLGNMKG